MQLPPKIKERSIAKKVLIFGFKINFKIICYHCNEEVNLAAGEVAINSDDENNIVHDQSKGLGEAKDITDNHICHCLNDRTSWFVILSGHDGCIGTVHLDREEFYIASNQHDLHFLKNVSNLHNFTTTLQAIHTLFENIERQALAIICKSKEIDMCGSYSASDVFKRKSPLKNNILSINHKQRPTYYTPSSENRFKSIIPEVLLGRKCGKKKAK